LLDDGEALVRIDRSGIFQLMRQTPSRLKPPPDATAGYGTPYSEVSNVVLAGLGGSAIAGEIVSDYCRTTTDVPVSVCRTVHIPKWIGKETLFAAISYSGETIETLGQLDQAAKRGAKLAAISSGGELLSRAKERAIPHLRIPSNIPPRVALPELTAAVMFTLGSASILKNTQELLSGAASRVNDLINQSGPEVPSTKNQAKKWALALHDKLPLIVGDEEYGSVLRRFKNQINENAKMPAFYYTLPEGVHNDIEGLAALSKLASIQLILLRTLEASEGQRRTRDELIRSLGDMGFPPVLEFQGFGPSKFSELFTAVTFGDFVSVYLAALRGVDPAELTLIPKFRAVTRG